MPFFGFRNWDQPGPGVDKDAPKPRAFFQFFILFGRKFWKYMGLNMLYILLSLPQIILLYFVFLYHLTPVLTAGFGQFSESELSWAANAVLLSCVTVWIALCGTGPTSAGYVSILRNYALEDHAWIISDFRDKIKENFRQSLVVFLTDVAFLLLSGIAIRFYGSVLGGMFGVFMRAFMILCLCIYMIMHWYIYLLMVRFRIKTYRLFTHSFVLTMLALPQNAGVFALLGGLLIGYHALASFFWPILALTPTLLFSFITFAWVFFAYRQVQKNVTYEQGVKEHEL